MENGRAIVNSVVHHSAYGSRNRTECLLLFLLQNGYRTSGFRGRGTRRPVKCDVAVRGHFDAEVVPFLRRLLKRAFFSWGTVPDDRTEKKAGEKLTKGAGAKVAPSLDTDKRNRF